MSTSRVNVLNIGLMLASAGLAFALPFELFLFSYAVLGPLHYLTQISWLHDRKYFVAVKRDALPLFLLCVLVLLAAGVFKSFQVPGLRAIAPELSFLAFAGALLLVLTTGTVQRLGGAVLLVMIAALLHNLFPSASSGYATFFLVYLTTIVHVFLFTGAFILLGSLRHRGASGYASFGVFLACAAACFLLPAKAGYVVGPAATEAYRASILQLHLELLRDLGLGPVSEVYSDRTSIAVGRFIAYAYTYHYLNWFSKTSIIRWHEVPRIRFVFVGIVWAISLALYASSYVRGLQWLFFLSLLHVFLEFPLNHRSFMDIGREVRKRVRGAAVPG